MKLRVVKKKVWIGIGLYATRYVVYKKGWFFWKKLEDFARKNAALVYVEDLLNEVPYDEIFTNEDMM